jgi:hypothetical protein
MRKLVPAVSVLAAALLAGGATAQVLYTLVSPKEQAGGWFGLSVSGAGDVKMDGCDDLIVGACYEDADSILAGRAYIFSGATGPPVYPDVAE